MERDPIFAFDTLYTNPQIQLLKLSMPLLPSDYHSFLAVYIKFLELRHTLELAEGLRKTCRSLQSERYIPPDKETLEEYFESISSYLSPEDSKKLSKIRNMLQSMEQFKQFLPILEILSQTAGDKEGSEDYMDILKGFLTEEQLSMFQMFSSNL